MTDPMPLDIKLMNALAHVLLAGAAIILIASGIWWALRHPAFALKTISVSGQVVHNNAVTLRAHVLPRMEGNFFTVNLDAARAAFESAPWVRRAQVRREFPNRLQVQLQEHKAVAYWLTAGKPDAQERLMNDLGEVFEANLGDIEDQGLPQLGGPDTQSAEVLAMYRALAPLFMPLDLALTQLVLSARGSWQAELDNNAVLELGRGPTSELTPRVQRFVQTAAQISSRYDRSVAALQSADLRHTDGYAIRISGVTALDAPVAVVKPQPPKPNKPKKP